MERRPDAPSSLSILLSTSSSTAVSSALAWSQWLGTRVTCTAVVVPPTPSRVRVLQIRARDSNPAYLVQSQESCR